MAKKDIIKLRRELTSSYIPKFEEFEYSIHQISKVSMVDPDDMEEAVRLLRVISNYISNVNSALFVAENQINEFYQVLGSQVLLKKGLKEACEGIREHDPDSDLLEGYMKKELEVSETVNILVCTKKLLCLPNSKKKRAKLEGRKPGSTKVEYTPFKELDSKMENLDKFIKSDLS